MACKAAEHQGLTGDGAVGAHAAGGQVPLELHSDQAHGQN